MSPTKDNNTKIARILIVDDEECLLASLRRTLRNQYEIVTTKDPVQALKIFELQGPFAVVISDYQMPFINGIELFSKIHAINADTQRVMLTGHAELQMAIDAVNRGKITSFLTKPMPAVSIRKVIADAIQSYKQNSENYRQEKAKTQAEATQLSAQQGVYAKLTVKETEVLSLLAKGHSNNEIALELNISIGTVKTHVTNLFGKIDVNSRSKLIAKAIELGLIKVPTVSKS